MDTKTCVKCREEKSVRAFFPSSNSSDGLQDRCGSCKRMAKLEWMAAGGHGSKPKPKDPAFLVAEDGV